jgi:hypothetical protein
LGKRDAIFFFSLVVYIIKRCRALPIRNVIIKKFIHI